VLLGAGWGETKERDADQGANFVPGPQFYDPADTALNDPRHVYAVEPAQVFAFGKEEGFSATRWRF
jgi:hypothetical protein